MFSVHTTPEVFENATITGHFRFVGIVTLSYSKTIVSKNFPSTLKRKAGVFKFLQFEEHFPKALFGDGLVWTASLIVEK